MRNPLRSLGTAVTRQGVIGHFASVSTPDRELTRIVGETTPGRALDLGCGTGRNALLLARHGWEVTGVDLVGDAVELARRTAADAGLDIRFLQGDVTRLETLDVGDGYTLLMDGGCYHMIPRQRREAYASSVTRAAAPGAHLVMVGFIRHPLIGGGVNAEELRERLTGWRLVRADPVPGSEMREYIRSPRLVRMALEKERLKAWRYQLRRQEWSTDEEPPPNV